MSRIKKKERKASQCTVLKKHYMIMQPGNVIIARSFTYRLSRAYSYQPKKKACGEIKPDNGCVSVWALNPTTRYTRSEAHRERSQVLVYYTIYLYYIAYTGECLCGLLAACCPRASGILRDRLYRWNSEPQNAPKYISLIDKYIDTTYKLR